jgi:putative spermidine/putrescine transport system ATP-binding protein
MKTVRLENVSKRFGKFDALRDVSLTIGEGEFLSLLGPSGCGKTTSLRLIAGFLSPDGGDVLIGGRSMRGVSVKERRIGIVFQNYALFPNLSVYDNVAFGPRARSLSERIFAPKIAQLLELVGLADRATSFPKQLSGGQQQRVALARALAIEPDVLLLDEPLSALDAKVRNALRFEIRRIQREYGITTIYVTHDQEEALSISDRVALMHEGRIEQTGTPREIYASPASLFVAEFIGVNNLLAAEYLGAGRVRWRDSVMTFPGLSGDENGVCKLVIRPERVAVVAGPAREAPGDDRCRLVRGTIEGRIFLGPLIRVAVNVGGERVLADVLNAEGTSFEAGTEAELRFSASDVRVLFG